MPVISVIIPTRKRNHLLPRALKSLYNQTFTDFEILLVDDNPCESSVCADNSLQALLLDCRIRVLENPVQRNAATARNVGLRAARGEWITYLDDDDAYHPTKLEKQLKTAQSQVAYVVLCGLKYNLHGRSRIRQTKECQFTGSEILLDSTPDTKVIFHRRVEGVFFAEDLDAGEDVHFFLNLVQHFRVNSVFNVPEPLVEVFPQAGNRVNLNSEGLWQSNLRICQDYRSYFGEAAMETYFLRSRLQQCKFKKGHILDMLSLAFRLIRRRGLKDIRAIVNTILFRVPFMRSRVVS